MGIMPIRVYAKLASHILMKCADAYTTHAATVRTEAIETYSLNEDSVYSIPFALYDIHDPLGDKSEAKRELGISEEFVILHFGMIRKYKGLPYLLQAFNDLPPNVAKNSKLLIAGEDWKEDVSIADLVEASCHKMQISFDSGYIPNEMVPKYFAAADIVVFPHTETCGSGAVSLTMAYGKPILASDLVTMRELMKGYEGVTYVQPRDTSEIRRCLEEAFNKWRSAGDFPCYEPPPMTWAEVVRQYENIFQQLEVKTTGR
jgi:glycosyltransferase involved in cell wall biosynthesis